MLAVARVLAPFPRLAVGEEARPQEAEAANRRVVAARFLRLQAPVAARPALEKGPEPGPEPAFQPVSINSGRFADSASSKLFDEQTVSSLIRHSSRVYSAAKSVTPRFFVASEFVARSLTSSFAKSIVTLLFFGALAPRPRVSSRSQATQRGACVSG